MLTTTRATSRSKLVTFIRLKLSSGEATTTEKKSSSPSCSFPHSHVQPILLPAETGRSCVCKVYMVLHQEPIEFVRQNLKWSPCTSPLLREAWIFFLQETSSSTAAACGISVQEEVDMQSLEDKQQGLEKKSGGIMAWGGLTVDIPVVRWRTTHPCVVCGHETHRLHYDIEVVRPECEDRLVWNESWDSEHPQQKVHTPNQIIASHQQGTPTPSALLRILLPPRTACNHPFGAAHRVWQYWEDRIVTLFTFSSKPVHVRCVYLCFVTQGCLMHSVTVLLGVSQKQRRSTGW